MNATLSKLSKSSHPPHTQNLVSTKKIHANTIKIGSFLEESSQLINSYLHSSQFQSALQLFDEIPHKDIISATELIGSLSNHNQHRHAFTLFSRLPFFNLTPTEFTFGTILRSTNSLGQLRLCTQLHSLIHKMGFHSNVFIGSSLVNLYSKMGTIEEAKLAFDDTTEPNVVSYTTLVSGFLKSQHFDNAISLFNQMPDKNIVSWNAIISGCSQIGLNEESIKLFVQMRREGMVPNQLSFPSVLTAASNVACLGLGRSFHALAIKTLKTFDVFVGNALISLYAKCGSLGDSVVIFNDMKSKNVVSWNALICAFAQNGQGEKALEYYKNMKVSGLKPNGVTLLGLLFGCSHGGLVNEACKYFDLAKKEESNILKPEHYACMIDLLSRGKRFDEAEKFIKELPLGLGVGFWKALLGGCHIRSNKGFCQMVARHILELEPKDVSSYVLVANIFSSNEDWDIASSTRKEMKEKRMRRIPGCSWIEIKDEVVVFFNGDKRHKKIDEIHMVLRLCLTCSYCLEFSSSEIFENL